MHRYHSEQNANQDHHYRSYSLHNFQQLPQIQKLSAQQRFEMEVVGRVLPFKTNNYVVDELINWDAVPHDPIFNLTFPQREMLQAAHFDRMARALKEGKSKTAINSLANEIRLQLNPHPAGQTEHNVPRLNGRKLVGLQHKYKETVLFFPSQGQTCHAYCSYCFRWPQFVGLDALKFARRETQSLRSYLRQHPEVTDVLLTGGDPMIMNARLLRTYLVPLLEDTTLASLRSIRIGTKSLSFWPYKFIDDPQADEILFLFRKIVDSGKHLAIMAHFSHPREMSTDAVRRAIRSIRATGAEIRTQAPILRHINDNAEDWAEMWQQQVQLGCVPYYMFVVRDTGAQHYFGVPLVEAWQIFREAFQSVSGLARTVRGPSMSTTQGKIQVVGVNEINGEKVIVLNMLQARDPALVNQPYFARYDEKAIWIDDLEIISDVRPRAKSAQKNGQAINYEGRLAA
ncbi:MAG: KamA family radical SAM protein [bacterium]